MDPYYQNYSRQQSNSRVLANQHFINRRTATQDINRTETDLVEPQLKQKIKKQMEMQPINTLQEDYLPAKYSRSMTYKMHRSYYLKNDRDQFREIDLLEDTKVLKYFGLGPYFYVEFMRRVCWLYFLFSLLQGIRIYINSKSGGLSDYSISFSTYLISTTLGNYSFNTLTNFDAYILALVPAAILMIFALFSLCWKCHFIFEISDAQENNLNVKPDKFCLEVGPQEQGMKITQAQMLKIFQNFGPVYQISLIRRHRNKLQQFQKLQDLQQTIKQLQLELKLQGGSQQQLTGLKKQRDVLLQQIRQLKIIPKIISVYVHYEFQKSKVECLSFFSKHYLNDTCSHRSLRCCCSCCLDEPSQKYKIQGRNMLMKNQEVPAPEDINWENFELNCKSKFFRYIFATLIILVFLAFSCTIIGICTVYVSTHSSNCDSITVPSTLALAQASTDPKVKTCFCNANLLSSLTDAAIKSYCSSELDSLYIEQGVQYAIIAASSLTNFLFGLVVDKLIDCTRPASQSSGLKVKTLIYTCFLIFNTIFLPILLYADIFGFKTSSYFSFITLISSDVSNFLQVDSLQFYLDYSNIWYRNVSPIFTNYLIFDTIMVWLMLIYSKYAANSASLEWEQGKILQKHMNKAIITYQFSPYKQYSSFLMILFMSSFLFTGIPVLVPLAFLDLLSRYIANRSLMQQNSTRVDGLGTTFNELSLHFLPLLLIVSALNSAWLLTANSHIYPNILPFTINIGTLNDWSVMGRELYLPFYICLGILLAGQYLVYHVLAACCGCLCSCCSQKKQVVHPRFSQPFSEHCKKMNILTSYNIKSNDKMRNAVTRLQFYLQRQGLS